MKCIVHSGKSNEEETLLNIFALLKEKRIKKDIKVKANKNKITYEYDVVMMSYTKDHY